MSLTRLSNLRYEELIERMSQFVELDLTQQLVFRGVLTKHSDAWSLFMGELKLLDECVQHEYSDCWYRYPNFQFICMVINEVNISELLLEISEKGSLPIPDFPTLSMVEKSVNWAESLIPSHVSGSAFPERYFAGRVCDKAYCDDSKLIAYGMPFYPSAFEYVKEFLGLERFHGSSDGRKGELAIKAPDRRGRIVLSDSEIRFDRSSNNVLSLVGAIDGAPVQLTSPKDKCEVDLEEASEAELWLVTDNDEVIDYRSSSEWEYRYETRQDSADLEQLLKTIADGESEHCEFKQYVDLVAKKVDKAWEIDKTVCAFSNHQGGKLFIGVDDGTKILGIAEKCQRDYKCDPLSAVELYQKDVTKRLQESLIKNQCFRTYLIEHNELLVLVVEVHKANSLNYLRFKNEAYIRRGASSPQMTLAEVQTFPKTDAFGGNL